MNGRWSKVKYPLVFPFKLSYGTYHEREGVIVEISLEGEKGYGEMSFVPYYGKKVEVVFEQLEGILAYLKNYSSEWTPWDLYPELVKKFQPDSFVLSAVDCALYDLYGKLQKKPIWQMVGGEEKVSVQSSLTVTQDDWKEKLKWQWPALKLKMGFEGDMELLREIRKVYDGDLRIDANSGWKVSEYEQRINQLVDWNVELVEQPVKMEDEIMLKECISPIPLAADESVQGFDDLERIADIYDVANIKLQKCGGITPALKLIKKCHDLGLRTMAGCMTESSVGIGAMAQLASYFDYLDLDGEHLIKADFGNEKYVVEGQVKLRTGGGLGQDFRVNPLL